MGTKVYAGGEGTVKMPGSGRGKKRNLKKEKRERNEVAAKKYASSRPKPRRSDSRGASSFAKEYGRNG